jgi:putative membrane protein insertion efficiency factor
MRKYLVICFIIFCMTGLYGEFAPWNSDLKSGDSLYGAHKVSTKKSGILNGAQGGAFFLVRFFQIVISPQDGPNCRHIPTCSTYGRQAVVKHGAFLGSILAGDRLLRCNPFYPAEKDPVPEKVFAE